MKLKRLLLNLIITLHIFCSFALAQTGAKYLVIAHNNFVQAIRPLVEWKTKKGVLAVCVPLSVTGNTPTQIKSYILNAYNNWNPRPEFILLVGSPDLLPAYNYITDDYYADISGNYRIELCIGRFHCQTPAQCSVMVAKTIGYEKALASQDTTWFCKGTTIIYEDYPPDPYYQPDCRYIRNLWLDAGYIQVDSFIDLAGHNQDDVINAINNGRAFVVYRDQSVGYWSQPFYFDPDNLNNGYKLPIVVSGTCATLTLSPGENMLGDDFLRAGTFQNPKGAVGFFGTSDAASHVSGYRSAVTKGFFRAIFVDSIFILGEATKRAKFIMDSLLPNQTRYREWNLLGDPELNIWTKAPKRLTVIYDTIVFLNQPTNFPVWVSFAGLPVRNALVCAMMDSTVYAYDYTDNNGLATLSFIPRNLGRIDITVTAHNFFPYEGFADVRVGNAPYLMYSSHTICDSPPAGNGDGVANPGETINLFVKLVNSGYTTACSTKALLRTTSQFVTITESIAWFGNIPPESIVCSQNPFSFSIAPTCTNRQVINFNLLITDTSIYNWFSCFLITVSAGKLEYRRCRVIDSAPLGNGNGEFGPQENAKLCITIANSGLGGLTDVFGILRTNDSNLVVTDSFADFGSIPAGSIRSNNFDPFTITVSPFLPPSQPVHFSFLVFGSGGTYSYTKAFNFTLYSDPGISSDPTGPDSYGYYCYDDTDTSSGQAPTFDWFEIAPPGPGTRMAAISNANDAVEYIIAPFNFRYYGELWGWMTVCSNGFLSMGRTDYRYGNNSSIPDTAGPMAMVAPFWDDLNTNEAQNGYGDIYQYYDTLNHRWIVEFKDVAHNGQSQVRETFQIILLDPAYYPTPTGDGEIIFQYQTVADGSSNTVGIEDYTETTGLLYLFNNIRSFTGARLTNGRVLRFTTIAPIIQLPWLYPIGLVISDSLAGNNNHIPEPGEGIQLVITLTNQGRVQADNVLVCLHNTDGNAMVIDSLVNFGTIPVSGQANNSNHPYFFIINSQPSDTILDFNLVISRNGYQTTHYLPIGLHGVPGIALRNSPSSLPNLECLPNPFSNQILIHFKAPSDAQNIILKIYDAAGRLVNSPKSLFNNQSFTWNGRDNLGRRLSSGVYFVTLTFEIKGEQRVLVKKVVFR